MASIYPAKHLILNIGGPAELLAITQLSSDLNLVPGVCIRTVNNVAVVDSGSGWSRKIRQVQWMPSRIDFLLAKAIFPLSSVVAVFADSLGDLTQAARVVAGLCRFVPYISDIVPPSLIVLSVKSCTQELFSSYITNELLEMLRVEHPHEGHTRHAVSGRWQSRFRSVQLLQKPPHDSWPIILRSATLTTQDRCNGGFGLSDESFQRLWQHAIDNYESESFDCLCACGIQAQVTTAAQGYLATFIRSLSGIQAQDVEIIASCLAVNAYRDGAYVSHPGLVFESFGGRLLRGLEGRCELMRMALVFFLRIAQIHRKRELSVLDQHKQLLRRRQFKLPGCGLCMLKVPTCQLRCRHQLCDWCLLACDQEACPLCEETCGPLPARPIVAGVRALSLGGRPGLVLRWLSELRGQLPGFLGDYFDIIVCTDECAWLVEDYFICGVSLPALSRKLKDRRVWPLADYFSKSGQSCVAIQIGSRAVATYSGLDDSSVRARTRTNWKTSLPWRGRICTAMASVIDRESELIWHCPPLFTVNCSQSARQAVQQMFAGLFFVEIQSLSDQAVTPFSCRLVVKCRLAQGNHLNAVVHTLHERSTEVYCEVSGACYRHALCDASAWSAYSSCADKGFSCSIPVTVHAIEDVVRIRIHGLWDAENVLDLANSPAVFSSLLHRSSRDEDEVADDDAATVITDMSDNVEDQISAIQKQLLELM